MTRSPRLNVAFTGVVFQKQGIAAGVFVNDRASGAIRIRPEANLDYPGSEGRVPWPVLIIPAAPLAALRKLRSPYFQLRPLASTEPFSLMVATPSSVPSRMS